MDLVLLGPSIDFGFSDLKPFKPCDARTSTLMVDLLFTRKILNDIVKSPEIATQFELRIPRLSIRSRLLFKQESSRSLWPTKLFK